MGKLRVNESISECIDHLSENLQKPKSILKALHQCFNELDREADFANMLRFMDGMGLHGQNLSRFFERACNNQQLDFLLLFMQVASQESSSHQNIKILAEKNTAIQVADENRESIMQLTNRCFQLKKAKGERPDIFNFRPHELN